MTGYLAARHRKRSRGQALVEFAIALPLIVLVIVGLIDMGRGIYAYNTLAQSARQANRMAMVNQNLASVKAQAVASAPTLDLTIANVDVCFKTATSTQGDCSDSTIDPCPAPYAIGCLAIVRTHMAFTPITPLLGSLIGTIQLSSTSIEPIEYVCPTATHLTCP